MNNWIEWHGGDMPVSTGTPVEVEHRDGTRWVTRAGNVYAVRWEHLGNKRDIVRYRLRHTNTSARLEAARRELEAAQAAYEAERRQWWEPEGGRCVVAPDGDIVNMTHTEGFRQFGTTRPTRQLAEQARDAMRVHNRALAYVHEHAPEWDGSEPWETYWHSFDRKYKASIANLTPAAGTVTGPRHVMEQLADDLNSGRVKL